MNTTPNPQPAANRARAPFIPAIVIGVGSEYRHDDGAAIDVINRLKHRHLPGVTLVISDGEPTRLIDL
jgi:hydrogenase maturation protease